MAADISKAAFDALYESSGLSLTAEQKEMLYRVHPLLREMIARATTAMPREAEPALTFQPEVK